MCKLWLFDIIYDMFDVKVTGLQVPAQWKKILKPGLRMLQNVEMQIPVDSSWSVSSVTKHST